MLNHPREFDESEKQENSSETLRVTLAARSVAHRPISTSVPAICRVPLAWLK